MNELLPTSISYRLSAYFNLFLVVNFTMLSVSQCTMLVRHALLLLVFIVPTYVVHGSPLKRSNKYYSYVKTTGLDDNNGDVSK